ncbi:ty3-gypsy retrotransposon protein [Tanacetum coccineum]
MLHGLVINWSGICGMLHGLVINWSSSAIETSRNHVNVFSVIMVSIVMIRRKLGRVARETLGIACGVAEYCYNTTYHSSIKMTPYQALYGKVPMAVVPYPSGTSKVAAVDDALCERDALLRQLRDNLLAAMNRMEVKANRKRRELEFSIGDKVLVKLQPYRQLTLAKRASNKLAKRYYGPFEVVERVVTPIPKGSTEGHPVEQSVAICGTRAVLRGGRMEQQNAYPAYDLEDKVIFEGTRNDTAAVREPRRTSRASVAPVWHKDFVKHLDIYFHVYLV